MDLQTPNLAPIMRYVTKIEVSSVVDSDDEDAGSYAIFYKFYLNPKWHPQYAVNKIEAATCWNNHFEFRIEEEAGCVVYAGIG